MMALFGLRVFSSWEPHRRLRVRIAEDKTVISFNQVFQTLPSVRAQKRLAHGYPGELHAITQGTGNISRRSFSVAEGQEAEEAEDCCMCTPEFPRKSAGANLRTLFERRERLSLPVCGV